MKALHLTLKTLFSGRIRFITFFAIGSFVTATILAIIPLSGSVNNKLFGVASNIFLGIGTSTLAAALITTFDLIKLNEVGSLIKFFSLDTNKKTAIVIPQFDKKYFEEKERGEDEAHGKTPNEISFISYADFTTAKFLVALFQEHNLGMPEILTDEEALEIMGNKEKIRKYKTFISLGLYSNKFSDKVNQSRTANQYFRFSGRSITRPGERKLDFLDPISPDKESWQSLTPDNQKACDLALIAKVEYELPIKKSLSVIILGGLNATGTKLLGEYMYKYWNTLLIKARGRSKAYELKPLINEKNFCYVFKISGKENVRYDENASLKHDPIYIRV